MIKLITINRLSEYCLAKLTSTNEFAVHGRSNVKLHNQNKHKHTIDVISKEVKRILLVLNLN